MHGQICGRVEGGAGCSPTTPLQCVNEKEKGQEESAGSTTEVLTEGTEGDEIAPVPAQHPPSRALARVSAFPWHL